MGRSIWKNNYLNFSFFRKIRNKKKIYIWSRTTTIPHNLIGFTVFVHNGKIFKKVKITREKIGFKFGMFVKTRNKIILKKKK